MRQDFFQSRTEQQLFSHQTDPVHRSPYLETAEAFLGMRYVREMSMSVVNIACKMRVLIAILSAGFGPLPTGALQDVGSFPARS